MRQKGWDQLWVALLKILGRGSAVQGLVGRVPMLRLETSLAGVGEGFGVRARFAGSGASRQESRRWALDPLTTFCDQADNL